MIYSMTGFASGAAEFDFGSIALELRAVNHRYLDLQLRLPDELRALEPALREAVTARVVRGKIECRVGVTVRQSGKNPAQLNREMLMQLAQWNEEVLAVLPGAGSLNAAEVLRWNGVLEGAVLPFEEMRAAVMGLLQQVLADFSAARAREGGKLAGFLLQQVAKVETVCAEVGPRIPDSIAAYEEKLATRLRDVMEAADEGRLHQEIAMFANKIDVDEELSRLQTHLAEIKRVVLAGGASGKRLDFLMQELHREANTLGSKSVDAEVSRASMEMKILIEQMREQVQNIE